MRVKVKEAAEKLGIPEQSLRIWLTQGNCPFGDVMIQKKDRYGRNTYYINAEKLDLYLNGKL